MEDVEHAPDLEELDEKRAGISHELPSLLNSSPFQANNNRLTPSKLSIVRIVSQEATQNGTQNVTIGELLFN